MRRIGIFGGSFNPIHNGHLHLAKTAMQQFDLQHVLFIPTYISPFKRTAKDVADGTHRLAMCRLAIAPYPAFSVSDYELRQKTVSYTVHTISNLHAEQPDAELVLLIGQRYSAAISKLVSLAGNSLYGRAGCDCSGNR